MEKEERPCNIVQSSPVKDVMGDGASREVTGYSGGGILFKCKYQKESEPNSLYFCRSPGSNCDELIKIEAKDKRRNRGRFSLFDNSTAAVLWVLITELTVEDSGRYQCGADNDSSTSVDLNVQKDLPFKKSISVTGRAGGGVNISCKYPQSHRNESKFLCKKQQIFTVTINSLTEEDSGEYWCGVESDWKSDDGHRVYITQISLTVTDDPASPPSAFSSFSLISAVSGIVVLLLIGLLFFIFTHRKRHRTQVPNSFTPRPETKSSRESHPSPDCHQELHLSLILGVSTPEHHFQADEAEKEDDPIGVPSDDVHHLESSRNVIVAVMAKAFVVVLLLLNALGPVTGIKLDGNGYTDILIAINPAVPQNDKIINQIKEMITTGSEYLFQALDNKVFFKEVKILVPPNWNGSYDRARRETYSKANVIIDLPHPAFGDDPYTKQMKGCGEESEYTHFTPDFLLNDGLLNAYGPRDKDALQTLKPLQSAPPAPKFSVIQRRSRVVCLILDVSGSMTSYNRLRRLQQAATIFLRDIVEEGAYVGIVQFSTTASIVLEQDDKSAVGDDVIFLTDGEATDNVKSCLQLAVNSGAIINTLALGPSASEVLITMANDTDGKFRVANDDIISNQLVDAFSSFTMSDGDPIKQTIQLVSTGRNIDDWFNGTVPIDRTVGNSTTFTIIYARSAPTVYIQMPSGSVYDQRHIINDANAKTITLNVPGTAEPGDWKYSFLNTESSAQAMTLTVTSRAARDDVHPVVVKAQMNQLTSDGSKPMVVFAEVSQNYYPVLGARVMATLQSDTGHSENLQLLDNGAGADDFENDGIYSRYFTKLKSGKYSLKVQVSDQGEAVKTSPSRYSGALYIPGYIVDGHVQLNPEKPPVNVQSADVGSFTRTITGESFVVTVPPGVTPNFPPNKITDLSAEIKDNTVLLNWTAPGEEMDEGTAASYEIRWSEHLEMLQNNFSNANVVNTSALQPQEAGSAEHYFFLPGVTIQNGSTLFFAVQSEDKDSLKSEVSNIARATNFVPTPRPPAISNPGLNLTAIVVSVCVVTMVACVIAAVTTWAMKRKKAIRV
ncbi:hypothetical protein MHYP_G00204790 [Metynnis hypsauchen]